MKNLWISGLLVIVGASVAVFIFRKKPEPTAPPPIAAAPQQASTEQSITPQAGDLHEQTNTRIDPGLLQLANKFSIRKRDFTPEQREELEKKFAASLKPAIEKFCQDYPGHIPFNPEDLSISNFVERIGRNERFFTYTFVLNGITIGVEDSNPDAAHKRTVLNYVACGPQMHQLNQVPTDGTAPTLDMPITREQIIEMVKADTGTEFQPSDVVMRPTGAASSLAGGAFVEIGHMFTPDNAAPLLSFVFGPDGKIVTYTRAPTF